MADQQATVTLVLKDLVSKTATAISKSLRALNTSFVSLNGIFGGIGKGISGFFNALFSLKAAVVGVGVAIIGSEFLRALKETADRIDELNRKAALLGTTAESLRTLGSAATLADSSAQDLEAGAQRLLKSLGQDAAKRATGTTAKELKNLGQSFIDTGEDIENGGKSAANALETLGISAFDATGKIRSLDDLLPEIADAIQNTTDPSLRLATLADLFGRESGPKLLNLLKDGRKGLQAFKDEATKLGGNLTPLQAKIGGEFSDSFDRAKIAIEGFKVRILELVGPALTPLINQFAEGVARLGEIIANIGTVLSTSFTEDSDFAKTAQSLIRDLKKLLARFLVDFGAALAQALWRSFIIVSKAALKIGFRELSATIGASLVDVVGSALKYVSDKIADLLAFFKTIKVDFASVLDAIRPLWVGFVTFFGNKFADSLFILRTIGKAVTDFFTDFIRRAIILVSDGVAKLVEVVAKGIDILPDKVKATLVAINPAFAALTAVGTSGLENFAEGIRKGGREAAAALQNGFDPAFQLLDVVIKKARDAGPELDRALKIVVENIKKMPKISFTEFRKAIDEGNKELIANGANLTISVFDALQLLEDASPGATIRKLIFGDSPKKDLEEQFRDYSTELQNGLDELKDQLGANGDLRKDFNDATRSDLVQLKKEFSEVFATLAENAKISGDGLGDLFRELIDLGQKIRDTTNQGIVAQRELGKTASVEVKPALVDLNTTAAGIGDSFLRAAKEGANFRTQGQQIGAALVDTFTHLGDPIVEAIAGVKSLEDAFRSFISNALIGLAQLLFQIALLRLAKSAFKSFGLDLGGDAGILSGLAGKAEGGYLPGPRGDESKDNMLIRAQSGEFVQRRRAVDYYGVGVMEALNKRLIPRGLLAAFATGGSSLAGRVGFAEGGVVAGRATGGRSGQGFFVIGEREWDALLRGNGAVQLKWMERNRGPISSIIGPRG